MARGRAHAGAWGFRHVGALGVVFLLLPAALLWRLRSGVSEEGLRDAAAAETAAFAQTRQLAKRKASRLPTAAVTTETGTSTTLTTTTGTATTTTVTVTIQVATPRQRPSEEETRQMALKKSGDRDRKLVVFAHLHASGGKEMCRWARTAHKDVSRSNVKLSGKQQATAVCNQIDPDPPEPWLQADLRTCSDMHKFAERDGGSRWMFVETAMDVKPPCPNIAFYTVIRQPWLRMESVSGKLGWLFPNASDLMKGMKVGDDAYNVPGKVWNYCPVYHCPTCHTFFHAGYFDNFYIRYFLGVKKGRSIPWGHVNQSHLDEVKQILSNFDLVIPIQYIADALPAMQCAVGAHYDLGLDGTLGGRYQWPSARKAPNLKKAVCNFPVSLGNTREEQRMELCQLFLAQNTWDVKLYEWAVERWERWDAGRCRQA